MTMNCDCNKLNRIKMLTSQQEEEATTRRRRGSCRSKAAATRIESDDETTTTTPTTTTACCTTTHQRNSTLLPNMNCRSLFKSLLLVSSLTTLVANMILSHHQLIGVEAAMNLPDGIENILGFIPRSSFQCERDGYFGDAENDCKLFHLCQRQVNANGRTEWRHWTYACGNQTMFNQLTLTCAFVDEAIPCKHASQFQYLNEVIHRPAEPFLTDADVTSGISYYSNRIMSDGARARAFEDSQLLAQIGGNQVLPTTNNNNNNQFQSPFSSSNNNNLIDPEPSQADSSGNSYNQQLANNYNNQFFGSSSFSFTQNGNFQQPQQQQAPARNLQAARLPANSNQASLIENHSIQLNHSPINGNQQQFKPQQSQPTTTFNGNQARVPSRVVIRNRLRANQNHNGQQQQQQQASSLRVAVVQTTTPTTTSTASNADRFAFSAGNGQLVNQFGSLAPSAATTTTTATNNFQQESTTLTSAAPLLTTPFAVNNSAQSFSFSVATNHQLGSQAESSPPTFSNLNDKHSALRHQFGPLQSAPVFTATTTSSDSSPVSLQQQQQPPQPVTASLFSSLAAPPPPPQPQSAATTTTNPDAVSLTGISTTSTLLAQNQDQATTTSQNPTTTTTAATTVPTTTTTTTASSGLQLRRRQDQQHQQPRTRSNELNSFARAHAGFQSARLSSRQQRSSSSSSLSATPLVMRRQVSTATTTTGATANSNNSQNSNQSQAGGASNLARQQQQQPLVGGTQNWSNDFWRRPFVASETTKFDSTFLTRRRV